MKKVTRKLQRALLASQYRAGVIAMFQRNINLLKINVVSNVYEIGQIATEENRGKCGHDTNRSTGISVAIDFRRT